MSGCRNNDVRIIAAPCLCLFLFIAFAGMDWVTRIQKSLLVLLILAQIDMFMGSFIDIEFGTCYVDSIEDGYENIDQDQVCGKNIFFKIYVGKLFKKIQTETRVRLHRLVHRHSLGQLWREL